MDAFHVNIGHRFARPYESEYAMIRRCLVVNPGIPWSSIQRSLRVAQSMTRSVSERLRNLQHDPELLKSLEELRTTSYQRQCPECAQQLYHTHIFVLPWLTHCPLHHCTLRETCPHCRQPWPDIKSLETRDCPYCGVLNATRLEISRLQDIDYTPIADIYRFIQPYENRYILDGCHGYLRYKISDNNKWWRRILLTSPLFPACQQQLVAGFPRQKLKALHIRQRAIKSRSSPLSKVKPPEVREMTPRREALLLTITKISSRKLKEDFKAMRNIVAWFHKKDPQHRLKLSSYRHFDEDHFLSADDFCPYCLALSLWFFHTATKRYGHYYTSHINMYPFWDEAQLPGFFDVCKPHLRAPDGRFYCLSPGFSDWFYRRGLEVLFVYILRHVLDWRRRLYRYKASQHLEDYYPDQSLDFPEQLCLPVIKGNQFVLFYKNEKPIEDLEIEDVKLERKSCYQYHQYKQKAVGGAKFNYIVKRDGFDFPEFLALHEKFRGFLQTEMPLRNYD